MSVPKSQHYVTKSYLRGFANGSGKTARLYIYERGKEQSYQQHPEKVAKKNYYYSFRDEKGQVDHSVEELLGMIETSALPIIVRVGKEDFQPDWIERGWLAAFMAMHEMRVPWTREGLESATGQLIKHMTRFSVSIPGYLERSLERMKAEGQEVSPELAGEIRKMVEDDQYDVTVDPRHSLVLMLEMMPELTERYAHMKWTIVRTAEDHPFVTSDNPLVRVNPRDTGTFYDGHGVDNKNIEIRFPLDKTTALIVMHDIKGVEKFSELIEAGKNEEAEQLRESLPVTSFMKTPAQLVEAVNVGTARYARRFVYAWEKNGSIREWMGPVPGGLWPKVG